MSRQLDLFGCEAGPASASPVLPALDGPPRTALAERLPGLLRLGTSSWSFPGWAGILYRGRIDPAKLARFGLAAYSAHPWLRTVGIDSTFYAPPKVDRLAAYAVQVPRDFRFLVKAPALLTDPLLRGAGGRPAGPNPAFMDAELALEQVVSPVLAGLGDRTGILLLQFPPLGQRVTQTPRRFAEALYRFLRRLPVGPDYAVELRDAGLLTRDLVEALRHGGAHPTFSVHPRLPRLEEQIRLFQGLPPGPLVVRWVLRPNRRYAEARSIYQPFDRLREPDPTNRRLIADLAGAALARGQRVFVIANNKAEGSAPLTLLALADLLLSRQAAQPDAAASR